MSSVIRQALLWLVMLALPLQSGMAAGMVLQKDGSPAHAQTAVDSFMQASAIHQVASADDCDGPADCPQMDAAGQGCILFASCGLPAAPAPSSVRVIAAADPTAPDDAVVQRPLSFHTDGPDRPPRSFA
ncbi:MAG: hypothetical protein HOQ10_06170 [Frateuria sp.]|nr:hypothetical protein [Frateuria sp.]